MDDIYERLADFQNSLPAGFPRTESGVELRILRKLFTPEEAELALHLNLIEEDAAVVAFRAHQPVEKVARMLDEMEHKGLVMAHLAPGKPTRYSIHQFIIGFWEGQVHRLDRELVELKQQYDEDYLQKGPWRRLPQMRTIPVGVSIPQTTEVMPYENIEAIVRTYTDFAVAPCICRKEREIAGHACQHPLETCLSFGDTAVSLVHEGRSRKITLEEALALVNQAEEQGLVLQPANSQNPIFLCLCCGCSCGILNFLKRQEKPADLVANPFQVQFTKETCAGCGTCVDRCQMEAITLEDGTAKHDPNRCIGCGLCVSTCPTGSVSLVRKTAGNLPNIPRTTLDTYLQLGQVRDHLNMVRMAGSMLRSKVDRVIAPRSPGGV